MAFGQRRGRSKPQGHHGSRFFNLLSRDDLPPHFTWIHAFKR